jgi:hypothetical protein
VAHAASAPALSAFLASSTVTIEMLDRRNASNDASKYLTASSWLSPTRRVNRNLPGRREMITNLGGYGTGHRLHVLVAYARTSVHYIDGQWAYRLRHRKTSYNIYSCACLDILLQNSLPSRRRMSEIIKADSFERSSTRFSDRR